LAGPFGTPPPPFSILDCGSTSAFSPVVSLSTCTIPFVVTLRFSPFIADPFSGFFFFRLTLRRSPPGPFLQTGLFPLVSQTVQALGPLSPGHLYDSAFRRADTVRCFFRAGIAAKPPFPPRPTPATRLSIFSTIDQLAGSLFSLFCIHCLSSLQAVRSCPLCFGVPFP